MSCPTSAWGTKQGALHVRCADLNSFAAWTTVQSHAAILGHTAGTTTHCRANMYAIMWPCDHVFARTTCNPAPGTQALSAPCQ